MNKEEVKQMCDDARRDQQQKIGEALHKFYKERHTDILFLRAIGEIFARLAAGKDID